MAGDANKQAFLDLLKEKVIRYRMRLFAYCLMDNHYHLVLQNTSGRMSDFFRNLNTQYARYYRNQAGGKGYVFQSRFHSMMIGDDSYLKMAIVYLLRNPDRAGLRQTDGDHHWSSLPLYRKKNDSSWLDSDFVLELFNGRKGLLEALASESREPLPLQTTPFGAILAEEGFLEHALEKFDRRQSPDAVKKRRRDDYDFDPIDKVFWEFERTFRIKANEINTGSLEGKRLRGELLVRLRDAAGLNLRQISEMEPFSGVRYMSLSHLYWMAKKHRFTES